VGCKNKVPSLNGQNRIGIGVTVAVTQLQESLP
jgi:hypothetical protein